MSGNSCAFSLSLSVLFRMSSAGFAACLMRSRTKRSPLPVAADASRIRQDEIDACERVMHGGHHAAVQEITGLMHAGRVHQHDLPRGARDDALNLVARRLRLVRHGRDLLADESIQERGLARVRPPDQSDVAAAVRLGRVCRLLGLVSLRCLLHLRSSPAHSCPDRLSHVAAARAAVADADSLTRQRRPWRARCA